MLDEFVVLEELFGFLVDVLLDFAHFFLSVWNIYLKLAVLSDPLNQLGLHTSNHILAWCKNPLFNHEQFLVYVWKFLVIFFI